MPATELSRARTDLYESLPPASRLKLGAAVFLIFSPLGLLAISPLQHHRSLLCLVTYFALCGLTAVGWVYAFMVSFKVLWVLVPSQVLWFVLPLLFKRDFPTGFAISLEGLAFIAAIVGGYIFFVSFIRREGERTVRLQTEIALAQGIHAGLIPAVAQRTPHVELYGKSISSNEMGGDVLDVVHRDGSTVIYVADVSGHGVRAGVVMAMAKSAIRMKLREDVGLADMLTDLNSVLSDLCTSGTFVTAACLRFDNHRVVHFSGAGHGAVLHYRHKDRTLELIECDHLPLAIEKEERYTARQITVESGDTFLLMTDGLTEVFDREGRILGQGPIEALFTRLGESSLPEIYDAVFTAAANHGSQSDDQTLLLARVL